LTEILSSPAQATIPTKRKPTPVAENSDDKQSPSKKGKKKGNIYPRIIIMWSLTKIAENVSSTTEDENNEYSILETLKDGNASKNHSV